MLIDFLYHSTLGLRVNIEKREVHLLGVTQALIGRENRLFNRLDLYHKSPDSGEGQYGEDQYTIRT